MSAEQLRERTLILDNQIRLMRSEIQRINHNVQTLKDKVKENNERIKVNWSDSGMFIIFHLYVHILG